MYICYNSPIEQEVVSAVKELTNDPKITLLYFPNYLDHGGSILKMLEVCQEEYIMLIEDDGYIFRPRAVKDGFEWIESGMADIVGSYRGSCALPIIEKAKEVWGTTNQGCNFWPNFFFIKKEHLLATDRNFNAKAWYKGDVVPGLNLVVDEEVWYGDTFVNTSLQLKGRGLRVHEVNQYHLNIDDELDAVRGRNVFDSAARWCHVGSLSSGIGGFLRDQYLKPLALRWQPVTGHEEYPKYANSEAERLELERRIAFWTMAYEQAVIDGLASKVNNFSFAYCSALSELIKHYDLQPKRIRRRINMYKELGL